MKNTYFGAMCAVVSLCSLPLSAMESTLVKKADKYEELTAKVEKQFQLLLRAKESVESVEILEQQKQEFSLAAQAEQQALIEEAEVLGKALQEKIDLSLAADQVAQAEQEELELDAVRAEVAKVEILLDEVDSECSDEDGSLAQELSREQRLAAICLQAEYGQLLKISKDKAIYVCNCSPGPLAAQVASLRVALQDAGITLPFIKKIFIDEQDAITGVENY